ncbi:peptide-methionine (R)-S-oxide reductase MsrB [uncultured Nevskia sp.]|uniref:peptide-methionine (R)-S-oxide reductase MsrB n=1 Tax=uncultured Nevskia sp. TaxID=228950 RepID=UPI0025DEFB84|nr:peptide-methionine (R)-S-oxide reductase MsrB [uncultured Nevskia sp.]
MNLSRRLLLTTGLAGLATSFISCRSESEPLSAATTSAERFEVSRSDEEWRKQLTPNQYAVLRREATERPYTSPLNDEHHAGTFACAGCDRELFASDTKFESGTGWPSFWKPIDKTAVGEREDGSAGMARTEVHCGRCGGHLGHVFNDGPVPTGLRYCMNGVAMSFKPVAA